MYKEKDFMSCGERAEFVLESSRSQKILHSECESVAGSILQLSKYVLRNLQFLHSSNMKIELKFYSLYCSSSSLSKCWSKNSQMRNFRSKISYLLMGEEHLRIFTLLNFLKNLRVDFITLDRLYFSQADYIRLKIWTEPETQFQAPAISLHEGRYNSFLNSSNPAQPPNVFFLLLVVEAFCLIGIIEFFRSKL